MTTFLWVFCIAIGINVASLAVRIWRDDFPVVRSRAQTAVGLIEYIGWLLWAAVLLARAQP